jgi:hypothetical protein
MTPIPGAAHARTFASTNRVLMTKRRILILIVGVLTGLLALFVCDSGDAAGFQKEARDHSVVVNATGLGHNLPEGDYGKDQ